MEHDDVLWLAGLLEGEGSFFTYGAGPSPTKRPCACVQVHMTDEDVIERACKIMNANLYTVRRKTGKPHWQQTYQARVAGEKAENVMRAVLPYMGKRRTEKINSILSLDLSHHPRSVV